MGTQTPFLPHPTGRRILLSLLLLGALIVAAFMTVGAAPVSAQAVGSTEAVEGAVPGNTTEGASADAELWRQVRQGETFTVTGPNPDRAFLVQAGGTYWERTRNGPLAMYAAWAIVGMVTLLSLFFALRGRVRIHAGKSNRTIKRFSGIERMGHWLLASSFIVLAITGLNVLFGRTLLLPLLGPETFATITLAGKFVHNYVAFAFMVSLVMVAVMWVVHNIPAPRDIVWVLRGGGILGGGHPPARKFNAGQKVIFWAVILCGVSISLSGWALLNPFTTTMFADTFYKANALFGTDLPTELSLIQEQQYQVIWHTAMAVIMIVIIIAHIYIGTIGMEGALDAMTSGDVDLNWAKEHHSLWVEEVQAKEGAPGARSVPAE